MAARFTSRPDASRPARRPQRRLTGAPTNSSSPAGRIPPRPGAPARGRREHMGDRAAADAVAVAHGEAEADHAHRLARRGAARSGDAGGRHRHVRGRRRQQHAGGHFQRHRFADRAEMIERVGRHVQLVDLGLVAVRDEAALEPVTGSGHGRECAGQQAAGAGLGRAQHPTVAPQRIAQQFRQAQDGGLRQRRGRLAGRRGVRLRVHAKTPVRTASAMISRA